MLLFGMKMNCSALLKQAAVCTCHTAVPLGQILESRCASESDCDQEDAARVSCLVDWSSKTEAKWFELVAVILDEFAYFAIETLKTGVFRRKQRCLQALVRSKCEQRAETVFSQSVDLLCLMFPVWYFQEDPQLSPMDRVRFPEQPLRIRRRHLDHYRRLAGTTLILNPSRFQTARELWSSQNNEADCMDMQESLVLLREEPLHAFCQD